MSASYDTGRIRRRRFTARVILFVACATYAGCPPENKEVETDIEEDFLAPFAVAVVLSGPGSRPGAVVLNGSDSTDNVAIVHYSWDVDARDGIQEDLVGRIVNYLYPSDNNYTLTLTVTDAADNTATTTITINVGAGVDFPAITAGAEPRAGHSPFVVQFSADSDEAFSDSAQFFWDFGDGNTSGERDPQHMYSEDTPPGAYQAVLTVTTDDGFSTQAFTAITVTHFPISGAALVTPQDGGLFAIDDPSSVLDGASVLVPPGAVSEPVVITLSVVTPAPLRSSIAIELGPAGATFSQPVTVSLPIGANAAVERGVNFLDPVTGTWQDSGILQEEFLAGDPPFAVFDTAHFTFFDVAATWTVTDLDTLGGAGAFAFGINNVTDVVGYSFVFVAANWKWAYRWDSTNGLEALGTLGLKHSFAFGINDNSPAQIAGYAQPDGGSSAFKAFFWDESGGIQDLGDLGGGIAAAFDVNDAQQVVGWSENNPGNMLGFVWDSTNGMQDIGDLGRPPTEAKAINNNGEIAGFSQTNPVVQHAFLRSSGGTMQDLGVIAGTTSRAWNLNDNSEVVGESETAGGDLHAFFWDATNGMIDLGTLGGATSLARAVNISAQVVGHSETGSGAEHAFGWDDIAGTQVMTDLNDLLPSGSDWVLQQAWDINDSGKIVGFGTRTLGHTRSFLLQKN